MKVLIVVTHLLGTGHLRRAMILARAFSEAGHYTVVASGGMPIAGLAMDAVELIQLPPLKSDGIRFTTLLTADETLADNRYLARRKAALLETLDLDPDVLITELFPFGRRVLSGEFETLLHRAESKGTPPLILASIRDILAPPSKPAKATKTHVLVDQYYDGVLVHSDKAAVPLSASWPVDAELEDKLHYTGFVASPAPAPHPTRAGKGEILVSAGGGSVGDPLFRLALAAAGQMPDSQWRLLVGGTDPQERVAALRNRAPGNVVIEPARSDFRQMLHHAACSVSMAGYNTALDILQTGVPAILVPFDEGGEVEQTIRAQALSHLPGIEMTPISEAAAPSLAGLVTSMRKIGRRPTQGFGMAGAMESVGICEGLRQAQQ